MTFIKHSILLIMLCVFLVACKSAPILNIDNASFSSDSSLSMGKVTNGIVRAGSTLGWRMDKKHPGLIIGTLNIRTHMAKVAIKYNTQSYSIRYKNSSNLDYKSSSSSSDGNEKIHSNYNGWIQNLDNAIQQQVY